MITKDEIIASMQGGERPYAEDIYQLVKTFAKPVNCIDLGTGAGSFLSLLGFVCLELGGKVWSVDKDEKNDTKRRIEQLGLPVEFVTSDDVVAGRKYFPDLHMRFDVVCIDTSHEYKHSLLELEIYSELLADKGIIILHDTSPRYNPSSYGVRKTVMEFLSRNLNFMIRKDLDDGAGVMIIQKV